ncbi:MAG: 7-carboxy-7-deazaguanine synthase QueE [Salibacteraceae bacterium]
MNKERIPTIYPVMEHFATVQGEGFHTGKAAYFIRLGGCDVGCHWCDVKESWPLDNHNSMSVDDIISAIGQSGLKTIVITGGEPTMYDLEPLTEAIKTKGYSLHIETSGAHELTGSWDWITLSPKKFKLPKSNIYKKAHELKVIVYHKSDFDFAEAHAKKVNEKCLLYLQPEWSKKEKSMELIVSYIQKNPEWRISLQTHKYLNIP